jgi:alpha-mannosidase
MGSRVIDLDIELSIEQQPGDDPWESYYAARFAWADWTAELGRSVHLTRQPTTASHLEAPLFLEIKGDHERTAILTGGNPYHRRRGDRKLDTILVARGETARRFRLGIGIDLPHPLCEAIGLLSPLPVTANDVAPASPSGWLFHVDALNVLATHWEPLIRDGRTVGYRVRLQETEGRSGQVSLRSFRGVQSAQKTDFVGSDLTPLSVEGDRVSFYMGAYEWVQVEAEFS